MNFEFIFLGNLDFSWLFHQIDKEFSLAWNLRKKNSKDIKLDKNYQTTQLSELFLVLGSIFYDSDQVEFATRVIT